MPSFTTAHMQGKPGSVDARVKLLLLIGFSVALFVCSRWSGMVVLLGFMLGLFALSKPQWKKTLLMLGPVAVLSLVVAIIRLLETNVQTTCADVSLSLLIALRFTLLAAGSLWVALTTSSTQLMHALRWLLSPLQHCGIRTQPAVTVLTMAVAFIPRVADELRLVYAAQRCRGAAFTTGQLLVRLKSWARIFIPVFVGLFRHADTIALAMDARCYGAPGIQPTALHEPAWTWRETITLIGGLALCVLAIML